MAGLYLTLRGTPIMYYGEEIGMQNNDPKSRNAVKDPIGRRGWPNEKGRDGERTPMQWNNTPNAGFTKGIPWLPIPVSYKTHNVAAEQKDPNSVLVFYQNVLKLRHTNPALLDGDYVALNENDPNVMSYLRRYKDRAVPGAEHVRGAAKGELRSGAARLLDSRGPDTAYHNVRVKKKCHNVGYDPGAVLCVHGRGDQSRSFHGDQMSVGRVR